MKIVSMGHGIIRVVWRTHGNAIYFVGCENIFITNPLN